MWVPANVCAALQQLGLPLGDASAARGVLIPADWVKMDATRTSLRAALARAASRPYAKRGRFLWKCDPCPYPLLGPFLDERCPAMRSRCALCSVCRSNCGGLRHRVTPREAEAELCAFLKAHAHRRTQLDRILKKRKLLKRHFARTHAGARSATS